MNPEALDQLFQGVKRFLESELRTRKEEHDADNVVSNELSPRLKRQHFMNDDSVMCFLNDDAEVIAAATLVQISLDKQTQTQTRIQSKPHTLLRKSLKLELFKCDVCGREFSSYQALGGHRASQKQTQQSFENANANVSVKPQRKTMLPSGKIHECSQCHKVFGTGQALGGHKRLHFNRTLGVNKRGQDAIIITEDKSSLSNANGTVKHVLIQDQGIKESEGVIGCYKRSLEKVVSEGDEWRPGSNGSEVTQVTNQVLSLRRSLDLNQPPLPNVDE